MPQPPTVLFLCVHNAGRSQMAAAWLNHLAGDRVRVLSGGSEPAEQVNPAAVAAMAEVGIDLSAITPRPWTREDLEATDVIVTMGCGDACPVLPGKRYLDWPLDDPAGQGVEAVRPIRDGIRERVEALMAEIGAAPGPPAGGRERPRVYARDGQGATMADERYTMTVTLDTDADDAEAQLRDALQAEGFGILTEIDVEVTLREKLGKEVGVYRILGACSPSLAHDAIGIDPDIGALLPCNVLVRANPEGGTDVAAADPRAMLSLGPEELGDLADDARDRIQRALRALGPAR